MSHLLVNKFIEELEGKHIISNNFMLEMDSYKYCPQEILVSVSVRKYLGSLVIWRLVAKFM